ncbi:hypothetical protein B0H14DRAFT_2654149 [Mycena olivaceomarginata]|nr:hypothetical protein B0H14DRAFT_2654149 [Mycena olivaceomarginata]
MHWNTTRRPSRLHLPAAAPCHPSTHASKAPAPTPPAASRYSLTPSPSPDLFRHDSPHPQSIHHRHPRGVRRCHPSSAPPTPILEFDLDDSDDNYEKGQALKKCAKTWQRNHGGRVSPSTKSEDEGKQKAVTAEVEVDGEEGEEDTEHHKSGPIPAETKKHLNDLYDKFLQDVDGLAAECGKSSTSLHEELHLVAKLPHATSAWNMWQSEDLTEAAVNDLHKTGKLKTKLQRELLPVTRLAQQFEALYKVHMWGYVIDPHTWASFVFGAGDDFKEMRAQTMTHIEQEIQNQELAFGNIAKKKREQGTGVHLVDVPDSDDAAGVPKRDAQLHNFTKIVSTQLWAVCGSAGTLSKLEKDTRKVKMAWNNKFIDRAREGEFHIVCYPAALEEADMIIGARKFGPKKIKVLLFDKFLEKLAEGNRTGEMTGVMHFEFWSQDEMDLPLEEQGKVAVVQNAKGCPLVRVKDSDAWHKQVDAEAKKAKKAAEKAWKKVTKATASKTRNELPPPPRLTFDTDNRGYPALRPNPTARGFASVHLLAPTPHPAALHPHALSRPANARVRLTEDTPALGTTSTARGFPTVASTPHPAALYLHDAESSSYGQNNSLNPWPCPRAQCVICGNSIYGNPTG